MSKKKAVPAEPLEYLDQKIPLRCQYQEKVPLAKLKPHPQNPNHHPAEQLAVLEKLIRAQGWRKAIVVSKLSGYIVKGHGTYLTAKKMKLKAVPVEYQSYDTLEMELADMVADNLASQMSETNDVELLSILKDVQKEQPDFDLSLFSPTESILLALKDTVALDPEDDEDPGPAKRKGRKHKGDLTEEDAEHVLFKVTLAAKEHSFLMGVLNKRRREYKLKTVAAALLHLAKGRPVGRGKAK